MIHEDMLAVDAKMSKLKAEQRSVDPSSRWAPEAQRFNRTLSNLRREMHSVTEDETPTLGKRVASGVGKHRDLLWLVALSALLVVILGHAESGQLAGLRNLGLGGRAGLGLGSPSSEMNESFAITVTTSGNFSLPPSSPQGFYPPPFSIPVPNSYWLLYVFAAVAVASALWFLLRGTKSGGVYDFASDLEGLEKARKMLEGSWSHRLKNAAIVNYYLLVRKLGNRLGVKEEPQETAREYLDRVSQELKVDLMQSRRFADVFNRARYGLELTDSEILEASRFMGGFVDGIRSRLNVG
jgi:hypothetical protein